MFAANVSSVAELQVARASAAVRCPPPFVTGPPRGSWSPSERGAALSGTSDDHSESTSSPSSPARAALPRGAPVLRSAFGDHPAAFPEAMRTLRILLLGLAAEELPASGDIAGLLHQMTPDGIRTLAAFVKHPVPAGRWNTQLRVTQINPPLTRLLVSICTAYEEWLSDGGVVVFEGGGRRMAFLSRQTLRVEYPRRPHDWGAAHVARRRHATSATVTSWQGRYRSKLLRCGPCSPQRWSFWSKKG